MRNGECGIERDGRAAARTPSCHSAFRISHSALAWGGGEGGGGVRRWRGEVRRLRRRLEGPHGGRPHAVASRWDLDGGGDRGGVRERRDLRRSSDRGAFAVAARRSAGRSAGARKGR